MSNFVFLLDALVLIFLVVVYLELTSKRNAYVDFEKSDYLNYFQVDGVADDVQIQEAIDYVSRIGGGATNLGKGTYSVDGVIEMNGRVDVVGEKS